MASRTGYAPLRPGALVTPGEEPVTADVVIIGTGMGGGTIAWALKDSGLNVLMIERGHFLPREPENSQPVEMYIKGRYKTAKLWYDGRTGQPFQPGVYYWVGGNTKVYGACLPRFRAADFGEILHEDGLSPAWPFTYDDLEPFYGQAEELFQVHGVLREDPTEPPHSTPYPFPALPHEPVVEAFATSLLQQGLHPFHMSNGMNLETISDRMWAQTSDGSPSESGAKSDAENRVIRPALTSERVRLLIDTEVTRLLTSDDGTRIVAAEARHGDRTIRIEAATFVVAAGAVNSAVLLFNSATGHHSRGLGNSTDLLGRNYMVHNSTFFIGVHPWRRNRTGWQKTLGMNDWYEAVHGTPSPLGNLQMLGKLRMPMVKGARPWAPDWSLAAVTDRSLDMYLTTEDLPRRDNRVRVEDGRILVDWQTTNLGPHREFVRRITRVVRRAGYPVIFTQRMGIETNSHMCGTAVAGTDPAASVLDPDCRSHDVANLWVVDSSFFPSSAAVNPALTIAANALRVAPKIAAATGGGIAAHEEARRGD